MKQVLLTAHMIRLRPLYMRNELMIQSLRLLTAVVNFRNSGTEVTEETDISTVPETVSGSALHGMPEIQPGLFCPGI